MSNLIKIKDKDIQVIEYQNQRVVTFKQIDEVHNRKEGTTRSNFKYQRNRFKENIDFFIVKPSDFRVGEIPPAEINNFGTTLFTERGYLKIAKTFNDDLAWEVQDLLIDSYFKIKEQNRIASNSVITSGDLRAIANRMDQLELVVISQKEQIKTLEPKADFYDTVTQTDEWLEMADVAKLLGGIGRNKIFELLRQKKVIIEHTTKPYQQFVDRGYFKLVETSYPDRINGGVRIGVKMVVSQLGIDFIRRLLARDNADNVIIKEINHERKERKHSKESLPGAEYNPGRVGENARCWNSNSKQLASKRNTKDGKISLRIDVRKQRLQGCFSKFRQIHFISKQNKTKKSKKSINENNLLDLIHKLVYNILICFQIKTIGEYYV